MNHGTHLRQLTISYMPGSGKYYPMIRLQGKWLRDLGFRVGDKVVVETTDNKIVITKTDNTTLTSQLSLKLMI